MSKPNYWRGVVAERRRKILNVIMAILIPPLFSVGVWGFITMLQALAVEVTTGIVVVWFWGWLSVAIYFTLKYCFKYNRINSKRAQYD